MLGLDLAVMLFAVGFRSAEEDERVGRAAAVAS